MSDHVKPSASPTQAAVASAFKLLARRSLSERELCERLAKRGFEAPAIADALASMRGYNYINDQKLAVSVAESAGARGKGPQWIRATLLRRGINATLAQQAATVDSEVQIDQARALIARRYGDLPMQDARTRQRIFRFLLGRGFSSNCALEALKSAKKKA